jgi:hypothetical protein
VLTTRPFVHEDLKRTYRVGGPKYLENAIRTNQAVISSMAYSLLAAGKPIDDTLTDIGNYILAEAQSLCPVRTGFLRASGYVRVL